MDNIPRNIKKRAIALLNIEETTLATDKATTKKQKLGKGRCYLCPRSADRKTPITCVKCVEWICKIHQNFVCSNCLDSREIETNCDSE
ncbi:unnamed protein product [Acanthoscelides obtectus]|uniref:PiggyBac transposable element-derived protein 4 C-terminal zinc-ribbon domain-containing protein n=1 Tax=Acanthoscelides obtectus TaxID=200917 RepID=A0A9P0PKH3_ACAOB|nr:unnamed protein product [Acanthoscelides obtectus]CAK1626457.1 hypothetical protein AOBTE_LOCUS3854 [Acanthoscelides obtectus]